MKKQKAPVKNQKTPVNATPTFLDVVEAEARTKEEIQAEAQAAQDREKEKQNQREAQLMALVTAQIDNWVEENVAGIKEEIKKQAKEGHFKTVNGQRQLTGFCEIKAFSFPIDSELGFGERYFLGAKCKWISHVRKRLPWWNLFITMLLSFFSCFFYLVWYFDNVHEKVFIGRVEWTAPSKKFFERLRTRLQQEGIELNGWYVNGNEIQNMNERPKIKMKDKDGWYTKKLYKIGQNYEPHLSIKYTVRF